MLGAFSFIDVVICAVTAFVATHIVRYFLRFARALKDETIFENNPSEFNKILEKCYSYFPNDVFSVKGAVYKRGVNVKIKTSASRTIVGKVIGTNENNELCVITRTYISVEKLANILEITELESR